MLSAPLRTCCSLVVVDGGGKEAKTGDDVYGY